MRPQAPGGPRETPSDRRWAVALGPALFALVVLLPTPDSMAQAARAVSAFERAPQVALGMLLWMVVWWVSECVPLGPATLAVPLVFGLLGVMPWRAMLASYMDPILWIFMAGFVLAAAFQKWGLNQRISLSLALAYKGDDPRIMALYVAALPAFFLTLTGSITASATIVLPFASAYVVKLGLSPGSRYAEGTMLLLGQSASAGAMLLLISTAPNLIAKSTIATYAPGTDLSFGDWFLIGTPLAFLGLAVAWLVTFRLVRPEMQKVAVDRASMETSMRQMGPPSTGERAVAALLVLTIGLWTLPSLLRAWADADPSVAALAGQLAAVMPEAMPAVLVIFLVGIVRVKGEPILEWREIVQGIDWNIIFLFGGGIVLGIGMEASGFAGWLAKGAMGALGPQPSAFEVFAIAALIGFGLTYAASNTAAALIACPLAATLAAAAGVSVVPPVLAAALAASISSALPSTTPPMAIVHSSGFVRLASMFKVGVVCDLVRLGALIALGPVLVWLVF
jgi:sodium-dependent dicarboxylate transporter 2/3/5